MGQSSTSRKAAPQDAGSKVAQQRMSVLELVMGERDRGVPAAGTESGYADCN